MEVPIVGQPCSVILWYPTSLVNCKCDPKATTIIVCTGFNNFSKCGKCGRMYCNEKVEMTPEGLPLIVIGMAVETPSKAIN